jgi:hypothetical protein
MKTELGDSVMIDLGSAQSMCRALETGDWALIDRTQPPTGVT